MDDMRDATRIAVVDDHPLFREGVTSILTRSGRHKLVAIGGSASDALEIAKTYLPDILLLDIMMPGGGLDAVRDISTAYPAVKVVMLTSSEDEADISTALASGARGYILKGIGSTELLSTLEAVAGGETYVSPNLAARVLVQMRRKLDTGHATHDACTLTHREEEILDQVAEGRTNKEIARHFEISEKTVKHYMTNIMQKLHVRNRVEAALLARQRKEVS